MPPKVQDSTEAFRGSANPLSNLHICPEGCKWENAAGLEMVSSADDYQFMRLSAHGHADKAERLLEETHAVDAMHSAHIMVLMEQESSTWSDMKDTAMETACHKKFDNCPHARKVLLKSRSELTECTSNMYWGTGLDHHRMKETLLDFWPGQNRLGQILEKICGDLLEDFHLSQIDG